MAVKNKLVTNPKTKQGIRFIRTSRDTGGSYLEMESIYLSNSNEPAAHYHPFQEEDFRVIVGELTVRIEDEVRVLKRGETLHIPANKVHTMWNNTNGKTLVNWKVRPAMKTEQLLETANGLASDGKTNENGMPGILQVALMANHFTDEFRLARPPFALQKALFLVLTPFAYLLGYRPTYKKYID